jgi:hypothetical protein
LDQGWHSSDPARFSRDYLPGADFSSRPKFLPPGVAGKVNARYAARFRQPAKFARTAYRVKIFRAVLTNCASIAGAL